MRKAATALAALALIEGKKARKRAEEVRADVLSRPEVATPLIDRLSAAINDAGHLIITLDGTDHDLGRVRGQDGRPGQDGQAPAAQPGRDGIGIADISIDASNQLVVKLTSGKKIVAGKLPEAKNPTGFGIFGDGASAYDLARSRGFVGTLDEWLESLKGSGSGGTITTNIPANTTFLLPSLWITNNATAAAATLDFISTYVETDY